MCSNCKPDGYDARTDARVLILKAALEESRDWIESCCAHDADDKPTYCMSLIRLTEDTRLDWTYSQMLGMCMEIKDIIDGYVDVEDGDYGVPRANPAMRAWMTIEDAIQDAKSYPKVYAKW